MFSCFIESFMFYISCFHLLLDRYANRKEDRKGYENSQGERVQTARISIYYFKSKQQQNLLLNNMDFPLVKLCTQQYTRTAVFYEVLVVNSHALTSSSSDGGGGASGSRRR